MNILHSLVYEVITEDFEFALNTFISQLFKNLAKSFRLYFHDE